MQNRIILDISNYIFVTDELQKVDAIFLPGGSNPEQSAWSKRADDEEGTQIDMIIRRKDNVVNMCEMKFYSAELKVDKKYHAVLINRQELLEREISSKYVIHNVLITTKGLKYNEYSGFFDNVITLDELFT